MPDLVERITAERKTQGLPPTITDQGILAKLATLLGGQR